MWASAQKRRQSIVIELGTWDGQGRPAQKKPVKWKPTNFEELIRGFILL